MSTLTCARLAKSGKRVDVLARSPDAEFILEGDEFDYDWYEVQVSPDQFHVAGGYELPDDDSDSSDQEDSDRQRVRVIQNYWRNTKGGAVAGLNAYPILAFLEKTQLPVPGETPARLKLLDGWHRLEAWKHSGDRGTVTALVSCPPKGHTLE